MKHLDLAPPRSSIPPVLAVALLTPAAEQAVPAAALPAANSPHSPSPQRSPRSGKTAEPFPRPSASKAIPPLPAIEPEQSPAQSSAPFLSSTEAAASPMTAAPVANASPGSAIGNAGNAGNAAATIGADSRLEDYGRDLATLLAKHQAYPRLAALRGWQGEVKIRLRLARKGSLIEAEIIQSSGYPVLDQQALQLVQDTPLPPPPTVSSNGEIRVVIPIHFRLNGMRAG